MNTEISDVVIRDGVIVDCADGLPDEWNNAVFDAKSNQAVIRRIHRIVPLKVVQTVRFVLSKFVQTEACSAIETALESKHQERRVAVLKKLDFCTISSKAEMLEEIAFQLGQTAALIDGTEYWTKPEIETAFPELRPFLRQENGADPNVLHEFVVKFCQPFGDTYIRQQGNLNLFCYKNSLHIPHWNNYVRQCRGIVIDMVKERCIYYPGDKFWRIGEVVETQWENLPDLTGVEIVEKVDGSMIGCFRYANELEFVCKGSIDVEQSRRAKEIAKRYPRFEQLDFDRFWYVFEVIYPENRFPTGVCVTDYGDEEKLVLIAMRDRLTNEPLPYREIITEAKRVGLPHPAMFDWTFDELMTELTSESPQYPDKEGYVARTASGVQLKMKYMKYVKLCKWNNWMGEGRNQFLKKFLKLNEEERREIYELFPAVFRQQADQELAKYEEIQIKIIRYVENFVAQHGENFPQYAVENAPKQLLSPMMKCWRGQSFMPSIPDIALKIFYGKVYWKSLLEAEP